MLKLRVLLADDHAILRAGLKLLINAQPDMSVIGEAGDGEAACRQASALRPDILVLDISMPELNGVQATERLKVQCAATKILVLSAYEDEAYLRQLLARGVTGYVLKRSVAEDLTRAIRTVAGGGTYLDPAIAGKVVDGYVQPADDSSRDANLSGREEEVLRCLAWGQTNREIAAQLNISVKTVETHKAHLMSKLDFRSRTEIVRYALRRGWLKED